MIVHDRLHPRPTLAKEGARDGTAAGLSPAPSPPAPARADVRLGSGQHRLPAGDRGPGSPCWGYPPGRQRLLCPRRRLPRDGCPLLHHHPEHARLKLIEAIPEEDWTPVPYWMDGGADVAETTYTPFQGEPGAAPVRLIVRRVKPTPGSQLPTQYRLHHRPGRGNLWRPTTPHAEIENAIRDGRRPPFPLGPLPRAPGWPFRCRPSARG